MVDGNENTQRVLSEASQSELGKVQEKVARLADEVSTKFDQGWHHTTASVETLQKKLGKETATRRHEVLIVRDVRIQEMTDVWGAVKAMQESVFAVESTAIQRLVGFKWTEWQTSCEFW